MKLITWNCQGAFRKKADAILVLQPDILVIQECEHPDKLIFNSTTPRPKDFLWFGDNKHKGLGIFSYSDYRFRLLDHHNSDLKIITPIAVTGGPINFTLFGIWANNKHDPDGQYIAQVWKALDHYDQLLGVGHTILTGDFNSNKIWDKPRRKANHSAVVQRLEERNIYSVYHKFLNQEQGKETHPTFYLHRNLAKPYHLDYCFASAQLYEKLKDIEIGTYDHWINHSDHIPLTIHFEL